MRMITDRESVNKYYDMINELVDKYLIDNKIRPSNLYKYLKPGSDRFNKFLLRNGLNEIKGTDRILRDIIENRSNMEMDGILTFESFKFDTNKIRSIGESIWKGIEKADISMEKKIADYFDTNLGSIDVVDANKHIFSLDNWSKSDKSIKVVIFSKDDFELISENIKEFLGEELSRKEVNLIGDIKVQLNDFIDSDNLEEKLSKIITKDVVSDIITEYLDGYKFEADLSSHFLWIHATS